MENRGTGLFKGIIWWAWLAVVAVLAAEPFAWEVNYFRIHGNLLYYRLVIALLVLFVPVCFLYVKWRRRSWYRYELPVIAAAALCLAAVEQPIGLGVGVLFFFACITMGRRLARLCGIPFENPAENLGLGFALGSAALMLVLFVLGLLHAYYWPVFLLVLVLPLAFAWRDALECARASLAMWRRARDLPVLQHPMWGVAILFVAVAVLCGTIAVLTPAISMDSVRMHLPDVETFVSTHSLRPVFASAYSYYPQGYEVQMAMAYALGGQPAAQMITPMAFVALLLVTFGIARLCAFDTVGVLIGLAGLLVTPFILWGGSQVKNDTAMTLFQLASLYCCLRWRASLSRAPSETGRRGWLILGAFLLAATFAIKHIAAFGAVPLTLLFIAPLYRRPRGVRTAAMFFLIVAVFGFYWHTRTFLLTGDPLYPRHVDDAVRSRVGATRSATAWFKKRIEEPWLVQFHDTRIGFESPLRSPMGILLLMFAPLALLVSLSGNQSGNQSRNACWFYAGLYVLLWGSRMTTLRYALGPIVILTVFVGAKVKEAYDRDWTAAPAFMRWSIAGALSGALAFGLLGAILVEIVPGQLPLLAHRINRSQYLKANLPGYAATASIGKADANASVILLNASGRAYAPNPTTSACIFGGVQNAAVRSQRILHSGDFQYAVLPVNWDEDDIDTVFHGWKTQEVYSDDDWRAVRLIRSP